MFHQGGEDYGQEKEEYQIVCCTEREEVHGLVGGLRSRPPAELNGKG